MSKVADILSDPTVAGAILRAKAFALANGATELSSRILLMGFYMLLLDGDDELTKPLLTKSHSLKAASAGQSLPTSVDLDAVAATRLPVGDSLRAVLAQSHSSVGGLIDALIEATGPEDAQIGALFEQVSARASAASRSVGEGEITADCFAMAAYFGFLEGAFRGRPGLAVHMATNKDNFEALAVARNWTPSMFRPDGGVLLRLSAAFSKSLEEGRNNRLLTGINLGAAAGATFRQRRVTAIHEAGHAVLWFVLRPHTPILQLSIIPVADSEGRLALDPTSPYLKLPTSRKHLIEDTCICLAGNIAQQLEFGEDAADEGVTSDLARATRNVWSWVAELGLDEKFGPVSLTALATASESRTGWLHDRAQRRVQQLLKECAVRTRALLEENWHHVQAVCAALLDRGTLGAEELLELMIDKGLADWPGVRHVRSVPVLRTVRFASESGVHATPEGPVHYEAGDAIVTGALGESWPVSRVTFENTYVPDGTLTTGQDGSYHKRSREVLALQLTESRNIVLSNSRGVLAGSAGDWIVDHGGGDLAIVSDNTFPKYYEIIF